MIVDENVVRRWGIKDSIGSGSEGRLGMMEIEHDNVKGKND